MFGFHKPKMYRSLEGCCICRAKSSSSRFTDSKRYEKDFQNCFGLHEARSGDICNACVLLVKRWKKLPAGSKKNWNHLKPRKIHYFKQKRQYKSENDQLFNVDAIDQCFSCWLGGILGVEVHPFKVTKLRNTVLDDLFHKIIYMLCRIISYWSYPAKVKDSHQLVGISFLLRISQP
uniref:Uncharacterized protein n=1 Tax=Laticauda laticaudata TaxID=8630 RepID=A0A8C5SFY4_LATLA